MLISCVRICEHGSRIPAAVAPCLLVFSSVWEFLSMVIGYQSQLAPDLLFLSCHQLSAADNLHQCILCKHVFFREMRRKCNGTFVYEVCMFSERFSPMHYCKLFEASLWECKLSQMGTSKCTNHKRTAFPDKHHCGYSWGYYGISCGLRTGLVNPRENQYHLSR